MLKEFRLPDGLLSGEQIVHSQQTIRGLWLLKLEWRPVCQLQQLPKEGASSTNLQNTQCVVERSVGKLMGAHERPPGPWTIRRWKRAVFFPFIPYGSQFFWDRHSWNTKWILKTILPPAEPSTSSNSIDKPKQVSLFDAVRKWTDAEGADVFNIELDGKRLTPAEIQDPAEIQEIAHSEAYKERLLAFHERLAWMAAQVPPQWHRVAMEHRARIGSNVLHGEPRVRAPVDAHAESTRGYFWGLVSSNAWHIRPMLSEFLLATGLVVLTVIAAMIYVRMSQVESD